MDVYSVAENLRKRRFLAEVCPTVADARARVLEIAGDRSVGIGGSRSVGEAGLYDALKAHGNAVLCHTLVPPEEKEAMRRAANAAEVYLCSANAVTADGVIVNIDGTGNRVAGTLYGPHTVIMLVGRNKLAEDIAAGVERTKRDCCPNNARRIGVKTPCAATGKCADCASAARMCNATVLHEYPTRNVTAFHVLLVDEELGW